MADDEEEYNPGQAQQNDYSYQPNYGAAEDTYKTAYDTYQEPPKQQQPASSKVKFEDDEEESSGAYQYKPQVVQPAEEAPTDAYTRYQQ